MRIRTPGRGCASIRNYGLINSVEELASLTDRIHGNVFGFDIETGYIGPDREKAAVRPETAIVVGISFTDSLDWARYAPLAHDEGENLDNRAAAAIFWDLLATGQGVAHNAGFELRHLAKWFRTWLSDDPIRGEAVRASNGYFPIRSDTLIEAYLVAEQQRFGLKPLTKELFGHTMTELHDLFTDLAVNRRKYLRFNILPLEPRVVEYACEDSVWCLAIHQRYFPQVKDRLLYGVEMAVVKEVLPDMEDDGIAYDWPLMRRTADFLRIFRDRFNAEIMGDLTDMAQEPIALNLGSPPQIRKILFDKLGLRTTVFTDKTRDLPFGQRVMSTGDIALRKIAKDVPAVAKILQWRELTKLLGSYLDKYEEKSDNAEDGMVHANHLSAFVITGRFAVSEPNYQQSPKKYHIDLAEAKAAHEAGEEPPAGTCFKFNFRDCIVAPPDHYILGFDLSQAELRAIAGEAQETALLEAFAVGDDVHRLTAALMLGTALDLVTDDQRSIGKTMNFALLYGMSTKGLADRLSLPIDEAQTLMDKYFSGLSAIAAYMQKQVAFGKTYGYVTSRFGRRLPIWEYASENNYIRQKGDRACVNYPIQGAATGDYMKIAMVKAKRAIVAAGLRDKIRLVMNVHDALEFYVHKSLDLETAIAVLQPAVVFPVPGWPAMKADWHIARRWGSPIEVVPNADGSITVKGEKVHELTPEVEVDEDGTSVEVMPEVDPEVLREAVRAQFGGRKIVLTLNLMPDAGDWRTFIELIHSRKGDNTISVVTPEGDLDIPFTTNLSPANSGEVARILNQPDLSMQYVSERAEEAILGLAEGLLF